MTLAEEKQIAEIENLRADRFKTMSTLFAGFSSAFGMIVVFVYCFFVIGFFPSGLSVGDTLLFIFVTLAFSCVGALLVVMGFFLFIPWSTQKVLSSGSLKGKWLLFVMLLLSVLMSEFFFQILRYTGDTTDAGCKLILLILFFVSLVVLYWLVAHELTEDSSIASFCIVPWLISTVALAYIAILFGSGDEKVIFKNFHFPGIIIMSGMLLSLGISNFSIVIPPVPPATASPATANLSVHAREAYSFIALGFLFAYIPLMVVPHGFNYVMSGLGFRSDAVLVVNKTNFSTMQAVADAKGILLHGCKFDSDSYSISNVRVLWHGIGLRSYIELKGEYKKEEAKQATDKPEVGKKKKVDENNIKIELDSAGIRVARGGQVKMCGELKNGIYFDSGKDSLKENQLKVARPLIEEFMRTENKKRKKKIIIVGFADPMPREKDGNFVLAHKRACTIYHQMVKDKLIEKTEALIDVRLDRDNISGCGEIKEAVKQNACFEQGRRVELQIVEGAGAVVRAGTADAEKACSLK
ncbi:hypothetical protein O3301_03065 [Janthinobacterium sp. SUN211]|uniref:hypothetical protein n=1 Tax=unclassified Janthinobacterium TaxID=2610881 RepID=UPI002713346A|nr:MULTISPECIES: hypothetical protein [unclassified Janthinobacterium]MDO8039887.1 hypothetical protein [Janthinobacterium sp. SUN137]MDO8047431.1 hypothetical protein [Janthinobacterium sp. SUN211]